MYVPPYPLPHGSDKAFWVKKHSGDGVEVEDISEIASFVLSSGTITYQYGIFIFHWTGQGVLNLTYCQKFYAF